MFGLVLLSTPVSAVDLLTLKFQAHKHPHLATSLHPVGPSASSANCSYGHKPHTALYLRVHHRKLRTASYFPPPTQHSAYETQCYVQWRIVHSRFLSAALHHPGVARPQNCGWTKLLSNMEDLCEYTVGRINLYAEVSGSTLSRDTNYPNRAFPWLFLNSETFQIHQLP
jgi:hypothetical protein